MSRMKKCMALLLAAALMLQTGFTSSAAGLQEAEDAMASESMDPAEQTTDEGMEGDKTIIIVKAPSADAGSIVEDGEPTQDIDVIESVVTETTDLKTTDPASNTVQSTEEIVIEKDTENTVVDENAEIQTEKTAEQEFREQESGFDGKDIGDELVGESGIIALDLDEQKATAVYRGKIKINNINTAPLTKVSAETEIDGYSWYSCDGNVVYFGTSNSSRNSLYAKPLAAGKATQIFYCPDDAVDIENATEIYDVEVVPYETSIVLTAGDKQYSLPNAAGKSFSPANTTNSKYEYQIEDEAVVKFSYNKQSGYVDAVSSGETVVKIVAKDNAENPGTVYYICHVTVKSAIESGIPVLSVQYGDGFWDDDYKPLLSQYVSPSGNCPYRPNYAWSTENTACEFPIKIDKASSEDMTDAEKTDSITSPYFYEKNSDGEKVRKWTCTSVYVYCMEKLSNGLYKEIKPRSLSEEEQANYLCGKLDPEKTYEITWIPEGTRAIEVTYYWDAEEVEDNEVNYNFNVGTGENQIPADITIYGVSGFLGSPHSYFSGDTANQVTEENNYTITNHEVVNLNFTINPRNAGSNKYNDYVGRTGKAGNYTYYELMGWKAEDGTVYSQGDSVIMGSEAMNLTAQWKKITQEELDKDIEDALENGPGLPLTEKYDTGTDALVSQHKTEGSGSISWTTETKDAPLLLEEDRMVYYRATMRMNQETASMLALAGTISDPAFSDFDIQVELDENVELVPDESGNVSFSFSCTFLHPDGKLLDSEGEEIPVESYEEDMENKVFTYRVRASDMKEKNIFTIHVDWIPGAYTATQLQKEIALEVARACVKEGIYEPVFATGVITGQIDLNKSGQNVRRDTVAAGLLSREEWKNYFTGGERELTIMDTVCATACVDRAMSGITLIANTVWAKVSKPASDDPEPTTPDHKGDNTPDDSSNDILAENSDSNENAGSGIVVQKPVDSISDIALNPSETLPPQSVTSAPTGDTTNVFFPLLTFLAAAALFGGYGLAYGRKRKEKG